MKKIICVIALLFITLLGIFLGVGFSIKYKKIDMVYINEVMQCVANGTVPNNIVYDYTIIDSEGNIKYSTKEIAEDNIPTLIGKAYGEGDIVKEVEGETIIFYLQRKNLFYAMRDNLLLVCSIAFVVMAITLAVLCWIIYVRTIKPFNKLKDFAAEVAKGNLDSPLVLDRYLTFGAFGEAFDIMRNNLRESRIAEQNEMLEKRKILQEIGHEIKTPLSTIKAVAECGMVSGDSESFGIISDKVNVIESMVNNFYQKALEEDGQLKVYITKHSLTELKKLIIECDYNDKINFNECEECNVLYDKIRMSQIVDNIIANSYKYAGTDINVEFFKSNEHLRVLIKDFGEGVAPEQLSFIMDRFYRGEKTAEKSGQGLGLYICRKLVARQGGEMRCYNDNGFVVEIVLPIYMAQVNFNN